MFQQLKLNLVNHDVDDVFGGAVAAAAVVVYCDREDGNWYDASEVAPTPPLLVLLLRRLWRKGFCNVVGTDPAPPPPLPLAPLPGKEEEDDEDEEGMVLFLRNPKLIGLKGGSIEEEEDGVPENWGWPSMPVVDDEDERKDDDGPPLP